MKTDVFTLCDYASSKGGRLTIVDTFNTICCEKLPWRVYFCLAVSIRKEELDRVENIDIVITNSESAKIFEVNETAVADPKMARMAFVANFKGLVLTAEGEYKVALIVDGEQVAEYPFRVILAKKNN